MEAEIGSQDRRLPPWGRLERVALHLAEHEQYRDLVVFVEAWARQGAPTLPARLAVCEAYVALRRLDQAWARLKDLVDDGRGPLDAVRLTAELYLMRGWSGRAAQLTESGLRRAPDDAALMRIAGEARAGVEAPEESPEPHTTGEMVQLAEAWMARGAFVKAQGLLERARRRELPARTARRADDLMWAIQGDFATDQPLDALCDALGPPAGPAQEGVRTEHALLLPLEAPVPADGFRQLFRDLDADEPESEVEEPTSISVMAGATDLRGETPSPPEQFADEVEPPEHTEILRVVHREAGIAGTTPAPAAPRSSDSDVELEPDYQPGTDVEDGNLVVVTRREPEIGGTPSSSLRPPVGLRVDKERENEALDKVRETRHRRARPRSLGVGPPLAPRAAHPSVGAPHTGELEDLDPVWPWWLAAFVVLGLSVVVVYGMVSFLASM